MRRLLHYVAPYWGPFLLAVLAMAAAGALDASVALLVVPIGDRLLRPASGGGPVMLLPARPPLLPHPLYLNQFIPADFSHNPASMIALAAVVFMALKVGCEYLGTYLINYVGYSTVTDLRNALYAKLVGQSAGFFHGQSTGRLMSIVVNDIERIQFAASNNLADSVQQSFTLVFFAVLLLALNWKLTLLALVAAPAVILPTIRLGRRVRRTTRRGQDEMAGVQHILHETVTGQHIVKAFNMEEREIARFREAARRLLRFNLRYVLQQGLSSPLMEVLGAGIMMAFLLYARSAINHGVMSLGIVLTFLYGLSKLYQPLRRGAGIYNNFQTAAGCSERVFEYLDQEEAIRDRPGARELAGLGQGIEFEQVAFAYQPGEPVLRDISFKLRQGEVVAVVGPSGAGKSTLVSLIPRFFDVTGGCIRIDGHDIRDLTVRSLRDQIAIVTQDTVLFNDTVANNIGYGAGRGAASRAAIEGAAEAALAAEFIATLPQGYDTELGERGVRLSGGQRQRIAIARALLKNAPILILDEATSALDNESERLVQQALATLMQHRTALVIAHRLSTIRSADRILVLEQGKLLESGSHEQLHASGGLYRRLYDLQFALLEAASVEPA